jgi:hypothetical protein
MEPLEKRYSTIQTNFQTLLIPVSGKLVKRSGALGKKTLAKLKTWWWKL